MKETGFSLYYSGDQRSVWIARLGCKLHWEVFLPEEEVFLNSTGDKPEGSVIEGWPEKQSVLSDGSQQANKMFSASLCLF